MEFKTETPTLVFDASAEPAEEKLPVIKQEEMKDEIVLTEEEAAQVEAFTKQIDLSNSTAILNYGAGTQKKLSSFSEKALDAVRTKDMGQVGEMITNLIVELKNFDVEEKEKGFKALFRKASNKLVAMKSKYAKVETNVNVITTELERHESFTFCSSFVLTITMNSSPPYLAANGRSSSSEQARLRAEAARLIAVSPSM